MDSPDKSQLILVSDLQESPFYRYLCDLSPIKPARSVHVAQTYSELSLPPPPAVFTSPPPNSHRPVEATNEAVYSQPASNGYAPVSRPDSGHILGNGHSSAGQSLGGHISVGQSNAGGQSSAGQSHGGQSSTAQSHGGQSSTTGQSSQGGQCSADQSHGSQSVADQSHGEQCSADQSQEGQTAADGSHGGQSSATSLNGFVPSPSGPDPADVELYLADLADAMTEESMHYGEVHHEKEHVQHAQTSSRVGVTGQRGIRRRCLDFEAAEARRKSMGNGVPRRCGAGGSRPTEVASAASYLASGASIPPQVLSERAGSQSDATNSGRSATADGDNLGPGRVEMLVSNEVMASSMMRMSRCSTTKAKAEQMVEPSQSARDVMPSPISVGVPSRIGLHLNSLAGSTVSFSPSRAFNCSMGMSTAALLGLTPMSALKDDPADNLERGYTPAPPGGNLSVVSAATFADGGCVSVVEITREERQDIKVADVTVLGNLKATTCFRSVTLGVKSVQSRVSIEDGIERRASPKRLLPPHELPRPNEVELTDEFFESPRSPKKRRKSAAPADKSSEGCRRCNCKKSKCLKLYCECFAAGIYCVGSCTCQDCLNKPEYEEKVMETRLLIESRNPLAFAPKIVHAKDNNSPTSDEGTDTPASARHKRGCNCKKSLCLKKYCECFQAGVGCSEGCRCEGCQNMFGKKEAFTEEQEEHLSQDALDENELLESSLEVQLLGGPMRSDRLRNSNKDWSPITPSFPQSGQGRSSSRLRAAVKKRSCRETPSSPVTVKSAPKPPRSPVKPPRLTRAAANSRSSANNLRGPSQYTRNMASPVSTPKSRIATLSPRWDGLGDICTLTPLPQAPVRPTQASASTVDRSGASPSFNRQCAELGSTYSGPSLHECEFTESCSPVFKHPDSQSPATRSASNCSHFQSPLHPQHTPASTHPTPPTPSLSSSQGTVGSKAFSTAEMLPAYLSFDSADDNDTPDFLKYSEAVQSPQILTKTSSPKQIKRVSPPQYDGLLKERGSRILSPGGGSPGLRSGRKFILQALPSFPSLTPFSSLRGGQFNSG